MLRGRLSSKAPFTIIKSGTADGIDFGGFDKWMGKITTLRLDFSNGNAGKMAYPSYIGFFPTLEMANAYAGEMPNDDDADSIIEVLNTAYENGDMDIDYESAATEATADAYIAALVESLTADAINALKEKGISYITLDINSTKYSSAENYWDDGEYTFTVDIVVGDKALQRSACENTYTVALKAKEVGKVFIPDATISIGSSVTFTPVITDITATSYQWYTCDDINGTNSVAIQGATSAQYTTPSFEELGSYFYKLVVNGTEEAIVAVSVGKSTEPVVFMFNNEYDLANWNAGTDKKNLVNVDGRNAFSYVAPSNNAYISFDNLSQYNDFYLQGYPYFVLSASYPEHDPNTFHIYIGADGYDQEYRDTHWTFNFLASGISTPVNQGFCKTVVNAKDGSYKSYDAQGNVISSGNGWRELED